MKAIRGENKNTIHLAQIVDIEEKCSVGVMKLIS